MYDAFVAGDLDLAGNLQLEMIPLNDAVTRKRGVPALKAAMDYLGLYGGPARKPILPLTKEVEAALIYLFKNE